MKGLGTAMSLTTYGVGSMLSSSSILALHHDGLQLEHVDDSFHDALHAKALHVAEQAIGADRRMRHVDSGGAP